MKEAHVYIFGEITSYQGADGEEFGVASLKTVRDQVQKEPDAEKIVVHIHSVGGVVFEGFAIHDYLRTLKKPIETRVEGLCASIATVIALAGDVRIMTENSDYFIHNPWGMAFGDREAVQRYADDLERLENKLADFYASKTKITKEEALSLMKGETTFTAAQALENGFITETAAALKIVAKFDPSKDFAKNETSQKNTNKKPAKMNKKVKNPKEVKNIFARLASAFQSAADAPVNKIVQDANGGEIDFVDLAEDDEPAIGDRAEIDGSPAEGEHVMTSGETFVFTAGELTEIKPAEGGEEDEEEDEALAAANAEIERLQAELTAANARVTTAEAAQASAEKKSTATAKTLAQVQKDVDALKKEIGSEFEPTPSNKKYKENSEGAEVRPLFKAK